MSEDEMLAMIDGLQLDKSNMQTQIDTLTAENAALQSQVAQMQEDTETQGARLTTALENLKTMTSARDQYKNANAALQEAIHKATASIPEMQQVKLLALEQMEETLTAAIRGIFAGMIAEAKGQ